MKKINKITRIIFLFLMIFSQLSSITVVVADTIDTNYEISLELDDSYNFNFKSIGSKQFESLKKYLLKIDANFTFKDGNTSTNNKTYYYEYLGSELSNIEGNSVLLTDIEPSYNGTYSVNLKIYDMEEYTCETLGEACIILNNLELLTDNGITNNITKYNNGMTINSTNSGTGYECINNVCNLNKNASNKTITNTINIETGNLNPNKTYFLNESLGDITNYNIPNTSTIDFTNLLYGTYIFTYTYRTSTDIVFTNTLTINYGDTNENLDNNSYFDFNNLGTKQIWELLYSYNSLEENEKELYKESYNLNKYNVYDVLLDTLITESPYTINSYIGTKNNFNETNYFLYEQYGRLKETDIITNILELKNYLDNKLINLSNVSYEILLNNQAVNDTDYLETGMIIRFNYYGSIREYPIYVIGDKDGDLVTDSDINLIIKDSLNNNEVNDINSYINDVNKDNKVDLLDTTMIINSIKNSIWAKEDITLTDTITTKLQNNNSVIRVGDTFNIIYKVSGIKNDSLNGLSGIVNYDKESLELVSIDSLNNLYGSYNLENNKFSYVSNELIDTDMDLLIIKFKALKETNTNISINDTRYARNGIEFSNLIDETNLEINISRALHTNNNLSSLESSIGYIEFNSNVLDYTIYVNKSVTKLSLTGTLEDEFAKVVGLSEYNLYNDITYIPITVTSEDGTIKTYNITVIKIKSNNNKISSLKVDDNKIDLIDNVYEYDITTNKDKLNIEVTLEDSNATYIIKGNESLETGNNIVTIQVTAEDGTIREYKLNVTKEDVDETLLTSGEDEQEQTNETNKVVITILVILVLIGLLYLIFKTEDKE